MFYYEICALRAQLRLRMDIFNYQIIWYSIESHEAGTMIKFDSIREVKHASLSTLSSYFFVL